MVGTSCPVWESEVQAKLGQVAQAMLAGPQIQGPGGQAFTQAKATEALELALAVLQSGAVFVK